MKLDRFNCGLVEVKFAETEAGASVGKFSGYGAIFGNVDSYGDVIQKGAFAETLSEWEGKGKYPPMLLNHGGYFMSADDGLPIGKWTRMEENSKGLKVDGELIALDTEFGKRVYAAMKAGTLDGMSIGYRVKAQRNGTKPEEPRRTLTAIELVELSVVLFPANDKARVSAVKAIEGLQTLSECEDYLRDACGLSRSQALAFVSRIKSLRPSDSEGRATADLVRSIAQLKNRI